MTVTSITTAQHQWLHGNPVPEEISILLKDLIALERFSEHPVAAAIISCGETLGLDGRHLEVVGFNNRPGFGITAEVAGRSLVAGNSAWLDELGVRRQPQLEQEVDRLDSHGIGSLRCAIDGCELAVIGVEDPIREDAADLIARLKEEGMQLTLLSGDRRHTAEVIAQRLGGMEVIAEVLPEEKDQVIGELQAGGHKVAMVGDGVNDAPALVRADVGIALGSGTDVSIASADIVLMSSELQKVHLASALSRRTLRTIRQNIGISITYNLIMVPLAMAAFVTPLVAAVSMPVSSLLVIANAARIRTLFRGIR